MHVGQCDIEPSSAMNTPSGEEKLVDQLLLVLAAANALDTVPLAAEASKK
jgi:hypothetical protein